MHDENLLFILAGVMMGPLVFNWRMVASSLRGLSIQRHLPASPHAGAAFSIQIEGRSRRRFFSSWLLVVDDTVERLVATIGRG